MNYDQAYAAYNGIVPDELRQEIFHDGRYHDAVTETTERNLVTRFYDLLRSICVWRREADYAPTIKFTMLNLLSNALQSARNAALRATLIRLLGDGGDGAAHQHDIGGDINPQH